MERFDLIWLVIGLPLIGFLVQAFLGGRAIRKLGVARGRRLMGFLGVLPIAGSFGVGAYLTWLLSQLPAAERSQGVVRAAFDWISLAHVQVPMEALIDPLSMTMVLIITGVGALIHLYATGYMGDERDYSRFFTHMNLFVAAMLVLVLANNLAVLFIGWEGVGLCSYLLIGFWYKDLSNARAANKAFIVNRIGDWGLMLGIFLLFAVLSADWDSLPEKSGRLLSFDVVFRNSVAILADRPVIATAIALLLFVGAAGKSAQFPLYLWLPDAMAGPTPVSALIHAATMVTAGVFLLNRMNIVFQLSPVAGAIVACVGAFTALFAAVVAFGQTDIKRVLAYSTVSQLGFMFIGCGVGAYWTGMFHVTTHAFFKALLFLGAGAVIYAMAHNQDMRNYGRLWKYLPVTTWTMVAGWLAIAGIALPIAADAAIGFAGFYSKESILGAALAGDFASVSGVNLGQVAGWLGLFVAFLTAMYMTRMTWLTFFGGKERWRDASHRDAHAHEAHSAHEDHQQVHDDAYGFFYTDDELAEQRALEEHEAHDHELMPEHRPREVSISMWLPLVALAALSVFGGWLLSQNNLLRDWLYPVPPAVLGHVETHPHHGLAANLLWLSVAAAFGGVLAGLLVYWRGLPQSEAWEEARWRPWRRAARDQFGYDDIAVRTSVEGGRDFGLAAWRWFDERVVDGTVNGVAYVAGWFGLAFRRLQTGYARAYALMMLAGGIAILGYMALAVARIGGQH